MMLYEVSWDFHAPGARATHLWDTSAEATGHANYLLVVGRDNVLIRKVVVQG